jgi:hypothetical protein
MERWTFDSVFSGPLEKQAWKMAHVKSGIRGAYAEAEQRYAKAIFDNDYGAAEMALREVTEMREFGAALDSRPELAEVKAYAEKLQKRQAKDELQKFLIRELGLDDEVKS